MLSTRQVTECFHLVFLRALVAKGEDKALIALKGGCNLRFYFESVRYSEDIDFDVKVIAQATLKNKVDRLLQSPTVVSPLMTKRIKIVETSAPKQTETTQRWKVGLRVEGIDVPIRTKIEFSRRDAIEGAAFEATSKEVLRPYALTPVLATHYGVHAAITQKIRALAGRTEPQVRDVFDLGPLLTRTEVDPLRLHDAKPWIPQAIERAMSLTFDDYVSKVVAYLEPAQTELFEQRSFWDALQDSVVSQLEALR